MTYFGVANSGEILFSTNDNGIFDFSELRGDVSGILTGTSVQQLRGIPLQVGSPSADQVLKYDGTKWAYQPDASGAPFPHQLLGIYHTDTVSSAAQRGDIIVGTTGNLWTALSLGTAGFVLYSDGIDSLYTRLGQNTPFELGTQASPSVTFTGDLDTGLSAQTSDQLIASASGLDLLTVDGQTKALNLDAAQIVRTRVVSANTNVTLRDFVLAVTTTPLTVTLPASPVEGRKLIIKDRDGNATGAASAITIAGNGNTIDGNANVLIKNAYASITLLYSGTKWNII